MSRPEIDAHCSPSIMSVYFSFSVFRREHNLKYISTGYVTMAANSAGHAGARSSRFRSFRFESDIFEGGVVQSMGKAQEHSGTLRRDCTIPPDSDTFAPDAFYTRVSLNIGRGGQQTVNASDLLFLLHNVFVRSGGFGTFALSFFFFVQTRRDARENRDGEKKDDAPEESFATNIVR